MNDLSFNLNSRLKEITTDENSFFKLDHIRKSIIENINGDLDIKAVNILPDFYKGNISRNKGGEIIFTDFESFGEDDPARVFLNFCHHLGHDYSFSEIEILIEVFTKSFEDKEMLIRIEKLFNYDSFDWLLILFKWDKEKFDQQLNIMYQEVKNNNKIISPKKEVYDYIFG